MDSTAQQQNRADPAAALERSSSAHNNPGDKCVAELPAELRRAARPVKLYRTMQDATSLLPNMSLQPLKPSSLVRRAGEAQQPSPYGYSRAKPVKVLQKQT
jgi:hypothetical protein